MEIQLFSKLENEIKSLAAQEENLSKYLSINGNVCFKNYLF